MLFLLFGLGTARYALPAAHVAEVLPRQPLLPLPHTPPWVAGLLQHRGLNVPVLDLPALATGTPAAARMSTRLVLVPYPEPGPAHGPAAPLLGLLVEHATATLRCAPEEFVTTGLRHTDAPWLGPVRAAPDGPVQRIRVADLLPEAVRMLLFPGEA